jgi:hypothetical protein
MEEHLMRLREVWLERAASYLLDYMVQQSLPRVVVRVSCGWPSLGGLVARVAVFLTRCAKMASSTSLSLLTLMTAFR